MAKIGGLVAAAAAVLVVALALSACGAEATNVLRRKVATSPNFAASRTPFAAYELTGVFGGDDPLSQVRPHLAALEARAAAAPSVQSVSTSPADGAAALVEVGTGVGIRNFCEICIMVVQMKERGEPHLCAGLNANYYVTCVEILESLLRADKAIVYWLKNGCMHMDSTGPEIVRPCPALPICSWVPNLFAQPPSLVRDGVESLCPKDPKFLPTIPNEYRTLQNPSTQNVATAGPNQS